MLLVGNLRGVSQGQNWVWSRHQGGAFPEPRKSRGQNSGLNLHPAASCVSPVSSVPPTPFTAVEGPWWPWVAAVTSLPCCPGLVTAFSGLALIPQSIQVGPMREGAC